MRKLLWLLLLLPLGLCACGNKPIAPTPLAAFQLPDGTQVGGAMWASDGFNMSERTVALFRCPPDKGGCQTVAAGTVTGQGYAAIVASAVNMGVSGITGPLLAPKAQNSGGVFLNAPDMSTSVQTNIGLAK